MFDLNDIIKKRQRTDKSGYTLAEVIIVMLVIAVVVGVSIKIIKAKLDNVVSYTYYSGYSILRGVTGQMVADFRATDETYTNVAYVVPMNRNLLANKKENFFAKVAFYFQHIGQQPACAINNRGDMSVDLGDGLPSTGTISCPIGQYRCDIGSPGAIRHSAPSGSSGIAYYYCCPRAAGPCPGVVCTGFTTLNTTSCTCVCNRVCGPGKTLNESSCTCEDVTPTPAPVTPDPCSTPTDAEKQEHYCQGEKWNATSCTWVAENPWPPCGENGEFSWSEESCRCVPETKTVPRSGQNFCEKFVAYSNTKSGSPECNGSEISSTLTDFSEKTPDITLRNGMKLYNVRQTPAEIDVLQNNTAGGSYDGVPNVNTFGYTVYLDIDGDKGSSTLWEDVFKFYITMSGKVIPGFSGDIGASNRHYLMTSVQKEEITADGHRQIKWIKKSVPFKEGACASGYIGIGTSYCSGETLSTECPVETGNTCSLKHISPVKFF